LNPSTNVSSELFDRSLSRVSLLTDAGVQCTDSSQCQSFCQAKEGSEINSESSGMCYGYELAICIQTVEDGVVQNELCQ